MNYSGFTTPCEFCEFAQDDGGYSGHSENGEAVWTYAALTETGGRTARVRTAWAAAALYRIEYRAAKSDIIAAMRNPVPILLPALLILAAGLTAQQAKTPAKSKQVAEIVVPGKLTFPATPGKVTFDHAAHVKREKGACKVCHDSLWPRDAKSPLNFKSPMHQTMQDKQTSCSFCHAPGAKAFPAKGNCVRCHGVAASRK